MRVLRLIREHPRGVAVGAVVLLIAAIGGVRLWNYVRSYESTDDAQVDGHLNSISPRIPGMVTAVHVEDNQFVKAGQILVDLDPRDYEVALQQAKAAYAQALAALRAEHPNVPIIETTTRTTISTGQADLISAQAGVAAALQDYQARLASLREVEAQNIKAQNDVTRYQLLIAKDEISRQQFDTALAAAKSQEASVEAAKATAEATRKAVDQRNAQVAQAESRVNEAQQNAPRETAVRRAGVATRSAAVDAAKAQIAQAELNLSYTKVFAPVDGIVTRRTVEVGQHLQPGQDLLSISQVDDIWVTANFKETQLKAMRPGQRADINVDAFGTRYDGTVESIAGASGAKTSLLPPENATGNYVKVVQRLPVRIRFKQGQDPEHRLRLGMSVVPTVWLK